ncbi:MAG TPA: flagellar motor protein [Burkholderiales bacterium]|nr:flagellar motor protein [Burkholderiales bacterium]
MDFGSLIGIAVALAGIIGGQVLEGGYVGSLLQGAAFLIVFGGTAGAVMVQSPARVFARGVKMAKWVVLPPAFEPRRVIADVVRWSVAARKEGLLSLEQHAGMAADPFARKGLHLLVDGAEPEKLREAMEVEIIGFEEHHRQAARIWEAAGGYSPTIGILGAVLGLIHVMENLSDPSRLGGGIAVAFVATIYGVGLANLVFLPVANKLKSLIARQVLAREMLVDGLVSIASGENPRMIENRLLGYVADQGPGGMAR